MKIGIAGEEKLRMGLASMFIVSAAINILDPPSLQLKDISLKVVFYNLFHKTNSRKSSGMFHCAVTTWTQVNSPSISESLHSTDPAKSPPTKKRSCWVFHLDFAGFHTISNQ